MIFIEILLLRLLIAKNNKKLFLYIFDFFETHLYKNDKNFIYEQILLLFKETNVLKETLIFLLKYISRNISHKTFFVKNIEHVLRRFHFCFRIIEFNRKKTMRDFSKERAHSPALISFLSSRVSQRRRTAERMELENGKKRREKKKKARSEGRSSIR